jgi:hypothetical protein
MVLMNRREMIKMMGSAGAMSAISLVSPSMAAGQDAPGPGDAKSLDKDSIQFWLETSLKRVYPNSPPGSAKPLELLAARNQKLSFQVCFRNLKTNSVKMQCEVSDAGGCSARVRRVGFVPMRALNTYVPEKEVEGIGQIPGLCPDPLFEETEAHISPMSNGVFWISLKVPTDAKPGRHRIKVRLTRTNEFSYVGWTDPKPWSVELEAEVDVQPLVIQPRKDFAATQWISADSIWEWYKIEPCGDRFWELADKYIADLIDHEFDVVYTPIFNNRYELLIRPAQLLRVKRTGADQYDFDFTDVRKWVRLALKHGARHIEWTHFFSPAPSSGKYAQHIYERDEKGFGKLLWPAETSATSDTYRKFLDQFMPQFIAMMDQEKIREKSLFHCADEPDGPAQVADYRKARELLRELAPWMKVMDAMSDPYYATHKLSDMPVPSIATAPLFTQANCPAWCYFCCGPRGSFLQRLLDTPLYKIRMAGWLFYKLGSKGFLHWGHNYWFKFCTSEIDDPFNDASVGAWPGLPYGDPFEVYPGKDGPIDSIRWEVFAESLQDYAVLQSAGIKPDDPMLAELKDYQDFPKSQEWVESALRKVLKT